MDALYNLSVDDLGKDINSDDTLQAGAKWQGVWTRDISYSIVLGSGDGSPGCRENKPFEEGQA